MSRLAVFEFFPGSVEPTAMVLLIFAIFVAPNVGLNACELNTRYREEGTVASEIEFNGLDGMRTYIGVRRGSADKSIWRKPMTKIKTLTALVILSTAVATPVFAKGMNYHSRSFRGAYNQVTAPLSASESRNLQDFGFSGRDRSFVGGEDPSLRPSGS